MGDVTKDSRFSHISNDPRFKTIPRSQRHVKIDKRFQSMFKDKRFKIKYTVDKRGRPISKTSNEDLERYYDLSSGSSDSEDENAVNDEPGPSSKKRVKAPKPSSELKIKQIDSDQSVDSSDEEEDDDRAVGDSAVSDSQQEDASEGNDDEVRSDDEQLTDKLKSKLHNMSVDYARGEGAIASDSSSDEESSDDEADETVEHGWGELDRDADRTDEITSRLAICNMDWDRIRAVDLMVVLSSFAPAGGLIRCVTIFPSEFGLKRMKKEEEEGPPELVEQSSKHRNQRRKDAANVNSESEQDDGSDDGDNSDDDSHNSELGVDENEEGSSYHMEKLRQYQLNRLKYYYAIVECDSANTANHIYSECDGMEYESSATRLDLRFVPDDTNFDQEPRETCSEMPDATKYRPRSFTTTALQQAKVQLTWDETDPTRTEIANRLMAGESVDDKDLQAYLASSSDGEDSTHEEDYQLAEESKNNGGINETKKAEVDNEKSGSDESDGEDPIAKYRSLLSGLEEEEEKKRNKDVHMEISWGLGVKEKTDEALKKRMADSIEYTPFQEMMEKLKQKRLEKKKQKIQKKMAKSEDGDDQENILSDDDIPSDIDMNDPYFAEEFKDIKTKSKKKKSKKHEEPGETEEEQQKKAELELLLLDKEEPKHFNFKKIQEEESGNQSKKKKKLKHKKGKQVSLQETVEDDFKVNVEDSRFSALYSSHLYNIDPTDPHFRKSNGMEALISAKQKRISSSNHQVSDHVSKPPASKKSKKDAELSLLVKSIKSKAQRLKNQ